jgi:DNA-binding CsgD family transcriptional regulator
MDTVLQLNPSFGLRGLDPSTRGRFQLRFDGQGPVDVGSVQLDPPSADGGTTWRVVLRDCTGQTVATVELWPEIVPPALESLTARQREILELVAGGCAVKTIASRLNISVKTVEFHKTRLMRRLGMHGTAELTRFAVAAGLISI